jgi:hypothetical protein
MTAIDLNRVSEWRKTELGKRIISEPSSDYRIDLDDPSTPKKEITMPLGALRQRLFFFRRFWI